MGYAKNYHARTFNKATRAMAWYRATGDDGITRCVNCTKPVTREIVEFDHIIAWELSRYSGPSNCQVLCADGPLSCHAVKTGTRDIPVIAKVRRLRKGRKVRHPMPCGRKSRWSKPMNGKPVPRLSLAEKHRALMAKRAILTQQAEA